MISHKPSRIVEFGRNGDKIIYSVYKKDIPVTGREGP
jgi:hypothetical protein